MKKILVIEDDQILNQILHFHLSKHGYAVQSVYTYEDAYTEIKSNSYELIILDVNLNTVNGFYLCPIIKSETNSAVIFLTAKDSESDILHGYDLGADLFSRIYHQLYQLQNIVTSSNNKAIEDWNNLQVLISDISHQVKTPLTNLNLLLSSFQQYDLSTEEKNSFINMMFGQLNKITSLLESMIKASRLENGIISIQPVLCSLFLTIKKAIEEIRSSLEKKEINLDFPFTENIFCFHDSIAIQ